MVTVLASAARLRFQECLQFDRDEHRASRACGGDPGARSEVSIDYHVDPVRQSKTQIVGWKVPWYTKCEFACPLTEDRASQVGGLRPPWILLTGPSNNMQTTQLSLLLPLFPFLLANAAAQSSAPMNRIDLHNGWTVQTSRKVQAAGEAISTPKFQTKGWYRTSVPMTIVAVQVAAENSRSRTTG